MILESTLSFSPEEYNLLPNDIHSDSGEKDLLKSACADLNLPETSEIRCTILKKSIDARKKNRVRIHFLISISDEFCPNTDSKMICPDIRKSGERPVIIGFGPAGMFAALLLAREGLCPVIIERGRTVDERSNDVESYFSTGKLCPHSNVQFGEGGAGTFSDGKLYSGVSDHRRSYVLDSFVHAGAPEEIKYLSHPHIGTDRLRNVVRSFREEIESLGGTFLFERTVMDFCIEANAMLGVWHAPSHDLKDAEYLPATHVILAIGHSSRDTFSTLHRRSIPMTSKAFSVGVRIEHLQEWINRIQYGASAGHPALPPADYKLVAHTSTGRNLYTFCMCPGGFVVASSSETGQVVTNGMSYYHRNAENANSALLVGVDVSDFGDTDVLSGVRYQEKIERIAFAAGGSNGMAPGQKLGDFLEDRASSSFGEVKPSYRPGVVCTNLRKYLPNDISETICEGIRIMNKKMPGFSHPDCILTGFETRSSSPVRILRDDTLQSIGAGGLYPCGEGAGYAGGIMSSAMDGLRCAERIIEKHVD